MKQKNKSLLSAIFCSAAFFSLLFQARGTGCFGLPAQAVCGGQADFVILLVASIAVYAWRTFFREIAADRKNK